MKTESSFYRHLFLLLASGIVLGLTSCGNKKAGEKLAIKNCSSCHLFPEPSLLPKHIWEEKILPQMGYLMGKGDVNEFLEEKGKMDSYEISTFKPFFPESPMVNDSEWKLIQDYYLTSAPDSLQPNSEVEMLSDLEDFFEIQSHSFGDAPCATYVGFDEKFKQFYAGTQKSEFKIYSKDFEIVHTSQVESPISDLKRIDENSFDMLFMGQMNPHNLPYGRLVNRNPLSTTGYDKYIADNLNRPVYFNKTDFNNDGIADYLVSSFGYFVGKLSWFEGKKNGSYEEHFLIGLPGSLKTVVKDLNNDGFQDFVVLMAQGNEGVYLFSNLKNGEFSQKNFVRLPSVYGSSDFVMEDFNNDGFVDLAVACGDNGDYSTIKKPYHGIHIYLNDGKWNFEERGFLPVHGSTGLKVGDFDNDGDKDLAVIAFFPDLVRQPERGFVFFENKGDMKFIGHISGKTDVGRWLVMDKSDLNSDGLPDITLGSCITTLRDLDSTKLKYWADKKVNYLTLKSRKMLN